MAKRKWISAEDLAKRLGKDPDYRKRNAEENARHKLLEQQLTEDCKELCSDLISAGWKVSLDDMVNEDVVLPDEVVQILLSHLNRCKMNGNKEMIVRSLISAENPFDGIELVRCFTGTKDSESVRDAILNTIASTRVENTDEWIDKLSENPMRKEQLRKMGYRRKRKPT